MKDRDPKQYQFTPGVDILFGAAIVAPVKLPSGREVKDLVFKPKLLSVQGATSTRYFIEGFAGIWTEIQGDDAVNAASDFDAAEVSKRAPKEG